MTQPKTLPAKKLQADFHFVKVGDFCRKDNNFIICVDEKWRDVEKVVYGFAIGGRVVRIGTTKNKFRVRMREWERSVSHAFSGNFQQTPEHEAQRWIEYLGRNKNKGELFAREGWKVKTPIGKISAYLAEESELISRYDLPMNNSNYR